MSVPSEHRKRIKHYHEPGDFHELTFSCYQRRPLLASDAACQLLAESVDRAVKSWNFELHAYVFMPEHVHLLVRPTEKEPRVDGLLKAIKRPFSWRMKQRMIESGDPLLTTLIVRERPGKLTFRFWQEGPGYDRNLQTRETVMASIDYIHLNPVKRKLCERAVDWKWSSARFYHSEEETGDGDLPRVSRVPAELLTSPNTTT